MGWLWQITRMNEPSVTTAQANVPPTAATNPQAVRPGWLSSEVWLTLLTHAGLAAAAISGLLPGKYAAIAGAASQAAYSLSRGLVKASALASSL
jgi:hypothetical protein